VGALPAPVTTTPWMENAPAAQAMTMVPPRTMALWLDTGLPFEKRCPRQEGAVSARSHSVAQCRAEGGVIVEPARR
jgi:hypothetical protein